MNESTVHFQEISRSVLIYYLQGVSADIKNLRKKAESAGDITVVKELLQSKAKMLMVLPNKVENLECFSILSEVSKEEIISSLNQFAKRASNALSSGSVSALRQILSPQEEIHNSNHLDIFIEELRSKKV